MLLPTTLSCAAVTSPVDLRLSSAWAESVAGSALEWDETAARHVATGLTADVAHE